MHQSAMAAVVAGANRSRPSRLTLVPVAGVMLAVLVAATWYVHRTVADPVALAYWWAGGGALLCCGYALFTRRTQQLPAGPGRTVAIVVAREEQAEDLHTCIWSILHQQGVIVDEVHVVDDGSVHRPVQPFSHPRVRWHRLDQGGRRAAQDYVLDRLEADKWDFVLVVDGDSVLDGRAVEHQLRPFTRSRVTATIGMRIVHSAPQRLLSRITEVHLGTSYARRRAYAPLSGTPETVPGAPTVYRADFLFRHRRCHLTGGDHSPTGDATFAGEVVGVDQSIAWTRTPAEAETTFRRLVRWSEPASCLTPAAPAGPHRLRRLLLRLVRLLPLLAGTLTAGYVVLTAPVVTWSTISLYAALYLLVRYAASSLYFVERPEASGRSKLRAWLLLTPVETAFDLFFLVPIRCAVLFRRDGRSEARPSAPAPLASGTVYFGGQLPPEPIRTTDAAPVLVAAGLTSGGTDPSDDREESHD